MNLETLQRELVALRIVEQGQLDDITREHRPSTADDLLAALERGGVVTPFLSQKLRKGETDGLVMGDYKLMYRNASGSFARVYRAQSLRDGTMVGLKVLRQRWAEDPKAVEQFHAEAKLGKRLRHPNIAPIYDIGVTGKYHWFSMEFVEGGNLREFIRIRGRVEPAECVRYLLEMARGLDYALGMGYTHRDLKMTNVLMSAAGVVKLIDFGLAGQGISTVESTHSRAIEYAAIENGTGAPANDPRSDLYFLGAILYELLAGEPPYPRTKDRETRASFARYRNVRPIRQVVPGLPQSVVDLVDRLLKVDPNHRFQRPAEVVREAEQVLRELGGTDKAAASAPRGAGGGNGEAPKRTVLCVEKRQKHLDMLREYFTKHGYRVLAMTDVSRALDRLDGNPPDCLVLMGGAIGAEIVEAYAKATARAGTDGTAVVAVLSESQVHLSEKMRSNEPHRVLDRIATLRDLRATIDEALGDTAS